MSFPEKSGYDHVMVQRLTTEERATLPTLLPQWSYVEARGAIRRDFTFPDFVQAFGFMAKVALLAQKADHHPEWSNVYGTVSILLTTHDADGLSSRDIALARQIDALL